MQLTVTAAACRPLASVPAAPAGQRLQPQRIHQGGANAVRAAEEEDQITTYRTRQDFDDARASGAICQNTDAVHGSRLVLLGVVVREGEVNDLLPEFRHLLAAVGRLHDGRDQAPLAGEGVEYEEVRAIGPAHDRADYAQDGLPKVVFSEASEPLLAARGETVGVRPERFASLDWAPWCGHGARLTLPLPASAWPFGELTQDQRLNKAKQEARMRTGALRGLPSCFGDLA